MAGSPPSQTPQRGEDSQVTRDVEQLLAEFPKTAIHLSDTARPDDLVASLNERVPPEVTWDGPRGVRILRRQEQGREILLLANPSNADAEGQVTLPAPGEASLWNPETAEVEAIGNIAEGQGIPLKIPAQSARFLVVE